MKGLILAISLFLTLYSLLYVGSVFAQPQGPYNPNRTLLAAMDMAASPSHLGGKLLGLPSEYRKDKKTQENNNMRAYRWRVRQIVSFSTTGTRFVNRSAGMPYSSRVSPMCDKIGGRSVLAIPPLPCLNLLDSYQVLRWILVAHRPSSAPMYRLSKQSSESHNRTRICMNCERGWMEP
jgi:hypothetical protein